MERNTKRKTVNKKQRGWAGTNEVLGKKEEKKWKENTEEMEKGKV